MVWKSRSRMEFGSNPSRIKVRKLLERIVYIFHYKY